MPWHTVQNHSECPSSRPWAVVKDDTGEVEGCHPSREAANDQLAALHAAEADQELQTMANDIVIQLGGKPSTGTPADRRLRENDDEEACPEGQHRMPDGSCMPDEDMSAEVETFHPGHGNQSVHGGGRGRKSGPPKVNPAGGGGLPTQSDVAKYKKKVAAEKKDRAADAKRAQDQIKAAQPSTSRRRRRGGAPQINPEASEHQLPRRFRPSRRSGGAGLEGEETFVDELDVQMMGPFQGWHGVLAVEGIETGDGREFAPDSLEWGDPEETLILLQWQRESEPKHNRSVTVGRIDHIERDGELIRGFGVIDLGSEDGAEVARLMRNKLAGGVSVDVDSVKDADIEMVFPDAAKNDEVKQDEEIVMLFGPPPEKVVFHRGRIRAATLVALPAFAEARLVLDDDEPEEADAIYVTQVHEDETLVAGGAEAEELLYPPENWFLDPQLDGPTAWRVTDEGRVYGHLALWSSCHTTFPNRCVTPPRERDYPYFMRRELKTREGEFVGVGPITLGTGHASLRVGAVPAVAHYDDTGLAAVDVAVGEDRYGIWVAGALRPELTELRLRELRGASLSGDWRRIGGKLRLVAVLAVNVPGYPVPRMRVGAQVDLDGWNSLVAAGVATEERVEHVREALAHRDDDGTIRVRRVTTT